MPSASTLPACMHRHEVGVGAHELHVVLDDARSSGRRRSAAAARRSRRAPRRSCPRPSRRGTSPCASCTSSMPTSSHCFCPWARIPAGRSASAVRPMVSSACSTCSGTFRRASNSPIALRCSPAAMSRFCRTLSFSKTVAVWNVRPMPRRTILCDFMSSRFWLRNSAWPGAVHQPGERVDQGGLAGAVRADEEVQPALEQGDVDAVDRLEAVEVDGQVADLQVVLAEERRGHAHHLRFELRQACRRGRGRSPRRPARHAAPSASATARRCHPGGTA